MSFDVLLNRVKAECITSFAPVASGGAVAAEKSLP